MHGVNLRALLAVVMLGGFYVLGAALFGALAWLAVWTIVAFPGSADAHAVTALAFAAAGGLIIPAVQLLRSAPEALDVGHVVGEDEAPGLWREVRDLAALVGTRPPDEIRLVAEPAAFVWQDTGALGLRGGRRYLCIGVQLLQAWPVARVRGVLAHELGHYAGRHTGLAVTTYRGMQAMSRTVERSGEYSPAGIILAFYLGIYAAVASAVNRRTELEADDVAARVAGGDELAAALQDLGTLSETWDLVVASYTRWARTGGYEPGELLERFAQDPRYVPGLRPPPPGPFDSHPPLADRVARLTGRPADGPVDLSPATSLVAGPDVLAAALRTRDFHDRVEAAARHEAKLDAKRLERAGGLDVALALLGAGRAGELERRLGESPGQYVVAAAVAAGPARWLHDWSRALRVDPPRLGEAVAAACADPAAVPALVAVLADLGVLKRRNAPLPLGALSGAGRLADELFTLSFGPDGRRRVDLRTFPAALAAAALTDLRLRGCVTVDGTLTATGEPAGDPFLDAVLERVAASRSRPVHAWLEELGPDVVETVAARQRLLGRYQERSGTHAHNDRVDRAAAPAARERILTALDAGELDGPDVALGVLLWAAELTGPVLGVRAAQARWLLGRFGTQDPIARAVRTVTGLDTKLPTTSEGP
ncbi:GPP34 family phosphoprotein [Dactylosporangium sp. CA-233914]|uniref:GPP34 family phosphoprotein n=1 Tax=Dactylosporangium sp. CA-233914 TaxID=3239934 RepID=UPI003D92DB9A